MRRLKSFEQRKFLNAIVACTIKQHFSFDVIARIDAQIPSSELVSGVASLFHTLVETNDVLKEHMVSLLIRSNVPSLDDSLSARRAIMAALAQDESKSSNLLYRNMCLYVIDNLHNLLEKSIKLFGDSLFIRHTPVLQQEGL